MNKILKNTLLLGLSVTAVYLNVRLTNYKPSWIAHHMEHQPLVRRPGYPLVQKVIENTKEMTVLISVEGFGGIYRGTGVLIDSKHVLTCYHMVHSEDDDLWIYPYPGKRVVKGKPVFGDKGHDLAILELDEPVKINHYAVFNTTTTIGEPITVVGNTEGAMRYFVTYGVVSAYFNGFIVTDALIRGGNSGGPWVDDQGKVIAISDWGYQENDIPTGVNGGVAAKDIVPFIDSYRHPVNFFELRFGKPKKGRKHK